jgi:hypothetical protein
MSVMTNPRTGKKTYTNNFKGSLYITKTDITPHKKKNFMNRIHNDHIRVYPKDRRPPSLIHNFSFV